MHIGVPTEIKTNENRVGLVPNMVAELVNHGHKVTVQSGAGAGIGITDDIYKSAGANIVQTAENVFNAAEMIVKVKEPQPSEYELIKEHHTLFTYLHLAPDVEQTDALMQSGCIAIAYETVTARDGSLPLLAPMSEVAGRIAVQAGARSLEKSAGGRGILLGGVPGTPPANVVVIGGGVVGSNSLRIALGMGARVTVLDKSLPRLRALQDVYGMGLNTLYSTKDALLELLPQTDLVIGAVLIPGATAPRLLEEEDLKLMRPGSVLIDVAIDQGGCFATSRPTTHEKPIFEHSGVLHYCVTNMPGAVPLTSTYALNNATFDFVLALANKGARQACMDDPHLMNGVNVVKGQVTCDAVARAQGKPYVHPASVL